MLVHAQLGVTAENSGKLVTLVRRQARALARQTESELVLVDGPPGIGCPAIAALSGTSLVLLVAEPTMSSFHDLQRAVSLAEGFKTPAAILINKYDLNRGIAGEIEKWAKEKGIAVAGRINYDVSFTRAQMEGLSIVEYDRGKLAGDMVSVWEKVRHALAARENL